MTANNDSFVDDKTLDFSNPGGQTHVTDEGFCTTNFDPATS